MMDEHLFFLNRGPMCDSSPQQGEISRVSALRIFIGPPKMQAFDDGMDRIKCPRGHCARDTETCAGPVRTTEEVVGKKRTSIGYYYS